ncbi:response regulator [bacterium]|nr:response regulator [bacterium]
MDIIIEKYRLNQGTNGLKPDGSPLTALIIDDSKVFRSSLREILVQVGYKVLEADTLPGGTETFYALKPDVASLDLIMPGCNGLEGLRAHLEQHPEMKRRLVVCTSLEDAILRQVMLIGVQNVFQKPIDESKIKAFLEALKDVAILEG